MRNWILLLSTCAVFAGTAESARCDATSAPSVYLFRGVIGYWPNVGGMISEMSKRGYCTEVRCALEVHEIASKIIHDRNSGNCAPIYLIGYSYGASGTMKLANILCQYGIAVDQVVMIECYDYPVVPSNVKCCLNIYESRCLDCLTLFRGTPAQAVSDETNLIDIDIATAPGWEAFRANCHFNMADDPGIQSFVAEQFPNLAPSPNPVQTWGMSPQPSVMSPAVPGASSNQQWGVNSQSSANVPAMPVQSMPYQRNSFSYRNYRTMEPLRSPAPAVARDPFTSYRYR